MFLSEQKGFVALISAILIAVALLTLVTAAGFSGFFVRFSILGSEVKEESIFLAESCVQTAILKLAQNKNYAGGETISVGDRSCDIVSITQLGSPWPQTVTAQASSSDAYTNLQVEVDEVAGDIVVDSWEECPNFGVPPCV